MPVSASTISVEKQEPIAGTKQDLTDVGCEAHDPNLYVYQQIARPFGNGTLASASTRKNDLEDQYRKDGMLVFPAAFTKEQVTQLDAAIRNLTNGRNTKFLDQVSNVLQSGKPPDFTSGDKIPWVQYEAGTPVTTSSVLQPLLSHRVRKLMGFVGFEPVIDAVVNDSHLLRIVARLLDCETVEDLELFQDMALLKPSFGREKPWHQDKAYFDIGLETRVVGCWIAVDEATCENGCMRMLRGGHTGPMMHFSQRDYQICDADALAFQQENVVAVPLPPGGLVLFDGMIPHGTPTNTTSVARRALQFHWVKRGAKRIGQNEPGGRTQTFGGSVNGLSC